MLHTNGDIAFVRDEDSGSQLYVVDATGGEPGNWTRVLWPVLRVRVMNADWSPDGKQLAYAVGEAGPESIGDLAGIYVLDVRTGESEQLTQCTGPCTRQGGLDGGLDWSPDGTRIAYEEAVGDLCNRVSDFAGSCSIYTMAPDGSDRKQLPTGSLEDAVGPSWSADGTHIAFSGRVGTEWNVYTMALDGSGLEGLSADRPSDQSNQVAWSPTGSEIAFEVVTWPEYPEQPTCELWTVEIDGSDPNLIFEWCEIGGSKIAFSGSGPEWSPDGNEDRVTTTVAGYVVIKPDGSDSTRWHRMGIARQVLWRGSRFLNNTMERTNDAKVIARRYKLNGSCAGPLRCGNRGLGLGQHLPGHLDVDRHRRKQPTSDHQGSGQGRLAMFLFDDSATIACHGSPAHVQGSGVVDGAHLLMRGTLTCIPGGNPLTGRVSLRFVYHSGSDTLTDDSGVRWHRS